MSWRIGRLGTLCFRPNFDHALALFYLISLVQSFGQIGERNRALRHKVRSNHPPSPPSGNKVNNIAICYAIYISYICLERDVNTTIVYCKSKKTTTTITIAGFALCFATLNNILLATRTARTTTTRARWQAIYHSHESVIYIILLTFRFAVISEMFFFSFFISLQFFQLAVLCCSLSGVFPLHFPLLFSYSSCFTLLTCQLIRLIAEGGGTK